MHTEIKVLIPRRPEYIGDLLSKLGYAFDDFETWDDGATLTFYHYYIKGGERRFLLKFTFIPGVPFGEVLLRSKNEDFDEKDREFVMDTLEFLVKSYDAVIET